MLLTVTDKSGSVMTYTYDACQHLKQECVTDADGVQLAKYSYGLGKAGERLTVTEPAGNETASYTRGDGILSMEKDGRIWYYIYDGHGSTRLLTDGKGHVTDRYAYDACGNLLKKEGD